MKKKVLSILLAVIITVSAIPVFAAAEGSAVANGIVEISKHGNVKINLSHAEVVKYFELGDIVTVSFGGVSVDVPLCVAFSDVDSGSAGLFCQISNEGAEETELAINMGSFAEVYGIASKITYPDKTYEWVYRNGFSESTQFTVTLKEKAGYLEEFTVRNLVYTKERENYPDLTDAQFGNFREVTAGSIKSGVLYRSSSPVEDTIGRNLYVDNACRENGITHFINLADSEEILTAYEGYADTYYSTRRHIAVAASVSIASDENKAKFAECYRYMIANPDGKFDVHCREGKDRTGMFIAGLECLMSASYDEVIEDYMTTYYNFYGVTEADKAYEIIVKGNLGKSLEQLFGVDPAGADLVKEAEEYLNEIGLSNNEIIKLKSVLSGETETTVILLGWLDILMGILPFLRVLFESLIKSF